MDWKMETANLIKDVGVDRLGSFDGCLCTHFAVQNVSVDVSCRKSPSGNPDDQFYGVLARVKSSPSLKSAMRAALSWFVTATTKPILSSNASIAANRAQTAWATFAMTA